MIRITSDSIRYRDQYIVTRKGNNIRITWITDGNSTFQWDEKKDGYIVSGYAMYDTENIGEGEIKTLDMIINAIDQAQGIEPDPYRITGENHKEIRTAMREYIEKNLEYIVEK